VVAKVWWQDEDLLARERANLDAEIGHVDAVCVGNEIMQKGISDADRLVREVDAARERWGRPVTTGFQPPDWMQHPDLATTVGDFAFLNAHPWWAMHRNDPLAAAAWVNEAYELVAATPGMPADRVLFVQETSFPSGAVTPEATPGATPENQRRFFSALLETAVPFAWFVPVDLPMYRRASPVSGFGGLWDEDWRPKPVVEVLEAALADPAT